MVTSFDRCPHRRSALLCCWRSFVSSAAVSPALTENLENLPLDGCNTVTSQLDWLSSNEASSTPSSARMAGGAASVFGIGAPFLEACVRGPPPPPAHPLLGPFAPPPLIKKPHLIKTWVAGLRRP